MGRLGRKLAEGMAGYERLPADLRVRFEAALGAAKDCLGVVDEVKAIAPELGPIWVDIAVMVFTEGKIGGSWSKVHREMAEAAPRLYEVIRQLIPKDGAFSL